jgi:hypothetical protein
MKDTYCTNLYLICIIAFKASGYFNNIVIKTVVYPEIFQGGFLTQKALILGLCFTKEYNLTSAEVFLLHK